MSLARCSLARTPCRNSSVDCEELLRFQGSVADVLASGKDGVLKLAMSYAPVLGWAGAAGVVGTVGGSTACFYGRGDFLSTLDVDAVLE